ncbi:MAG: luciferase domain-containing protein [Sulfobacillus sp.]
MEVSSQGLSRRPGARPKTTPTNPHQQLTDTAPLEMQRRLAELAFLLADVEEHPSQISVPGTRALCLSRKWAAGPGEAFMIGREFAHLHPAHDGSLHLALPPQLAAEACAQGWAEVHPVARLGLIPSNVVMIYGPRDETEVQIILDLLRQSRDFAKGQTHA